MSEEITQIDPDRAAKILELQSKLKPGILVGKTIGKRLVPVGQCDGIIFLGEKVKYTAAGPEKVVAGVDAGFQERALCYLRPMSMEWRALRLHQGRPELGVSMPKIQFLFDEEIKKAAADAGRPIEWLFTQDQHCIDASRKEHRDRWQVFAVEEGVWAVLYV